MRHLSDEILVRLSNFVNAKFGLHFPRERWRDLERGMQSALPQLCIQNLEECAEMILRGPLTRPQMDILAAHLTVGETYFYRDKTLFSILEEEVLPALVQRRRGKEQRLRIWSAGCCTGEEPYSLATIVRKVIPDLSNWNVTILGTDLNPRFLHKASEGIYSKWSFRDTPAWVAERFFNKIDGRFEILPEIKQMVTFSYLNLAEDSYPSLLNNTNAMDLILCRNVLMYFSQAQIAKVLAKFHSALLDGGCLVVSPAETSLLADAAVRPTSVRGVTLFRKEPRVAKTSSIVNLPAAEQARMPWLPSSPLPMHAGTPSNAALHDEAVQLYESSDYAGAIDLLSQLLARDAANVDALILSARIHANRGDLTDALKCCRRALAIRKLSPELHYLEATILHEQGALMESAASLQRTLYLDPNFVLAHFSLGNVALHQDKISDANKHYRNSLALLEDFVAEQILPGSEGLTAGRLREIIRASIEQEAAA